MSKIKVLIVDDEPDVVNTLMDVLNTEGFEPIAAYDGISAIDIADTDRPDIILLDIMMPMMSGYEVCNQLKSNPRTRDIPVLCLTSAHSADVRTRAKEAGAQTLLTKPILPQELVAQLNRHLEEAAAAKATED